MPARSLCGPTGQSEPRAPSSIQGDDLHLARLALSPLPALARWRAQERWAVMPVRSGPALGLGQPATAQLPTQHPRLQCRAEARAGYAAAAQAPGVGVAATSAGRRWGRTEGET